MSKPTGCIFHLSKEEFPGGINKVVEWLKRKSIGNGEYRFNKKSARGLQVGSIVLFSIEGKIVGQGTVQQLNYPNYIVLEPSSILIFKKRRRPEVADIKQNTEIKFSRLFSYIPNIEDYRYIVEKTGLLQNKKDQNLLRKSDTRIEETLSLGNTVR